MKVQLELNYARTENGAHLFEEAHSDRIVSIPIELLPEVFTDVAAGDSDYQPRAVTLTLECPKPR